ncbi:MAG: hypothetical protein ACFFCW_49625 [Candidatus Hodarchaeota archaeon]
MAPVVAKGYPELELRGDFGDWVGRVERNWMGLKFEIIKDGCQMFGLTLTLVSKMGIGVNSRLDPL